MDLIVFMILFPLLPAILLLLLKSRSAVKIITLLSTAIVSAGSIAVAVKFTHITGNPQFFEVASATPSHLILAGEIALALVFIFVCRNLKFRRIWIPLLVIVQYIPVIFFSFTGRIPDPRYCFYVDNLTVIMALLIGIVGGLITIHTIGYMRHYHEEHPDITDRSNQFIATIFLFFSAMYGIIFSNSIEWIYLFWEVTTLCSFIMIGYSRTKEAEHNSFRALWMLLLGGLAFAVAILFVSFSSTFSTIELQEIIQVIKANRSAKTASAILLLPIVCICFAGINKAAQFPFSAWLLGAMVAPTPSSALLHSSTMVKAGVFICIRCSPVLLGTVSGQVVAYIGGFTFLAASAIAISQRNGKRVLAYSTVANLGLIILCAGIGTHLALWAAILLIIFHGVAKALLFLCVGVVDQQIHSLDIEDMHGLISRMPVLTVMILIGMSGMFLAPFGMLISKWAVLESLTDANPLFAIFVIFGGTMMLFFWGKWMGALVAELGPEQTEEIGLGKSEWSSLAALTVLTMLACATFPLIGKYMIEPMYGKDFTVMNMSHIIMIMIMLGLVMMIPLGFLLHQRHVRYVVPYLGGANRRDYHSFTDSFGNPVRFGLSNYYLKESFSEDSLLRSSNIVALLFILIMYIQVLF